MKFLKPLKLLFSKYIFIVLLFLVQILLIDIVFYLIIAYVPWIILGIFLVDMLLFFHIINKKEAPEFKIPWIFVTFMFPIVGALFYAFFRNHGMRKKEYRTVVDIMDKMTPILEETEEEKLHYEEAVGSTKPAFDYLKKTNYKGYEHSKVTYFPSGEEYFKDMIEWMKKAEHFIFIEFFIVDRGSLWDEIHEVLKEKASQGVDVRLMFDDIGTMEKMSYRYRRQLRKEGIKITVFTPVRPIISSMYNNRDHRKIVIIDHKAGYTGGNNLADEYANRIERFGYWKDTGIRIEGPAIENLLALFLSSWDLQNKCRSDYEALMKMDYPVFDEPGYVLPFGDGPKPYYNELIGEATFIQMLSEAKDYVYISSPYFIPTHALMVALRNAAIRGVKVKLMLPGKPDKKIAYNLAKSNFKYIAEAGVEIMIYKPGFNHNKCVLVDGKLAFIGTINFDYRSLVHHFECGCLMYNTPCIQEIEKDFEETFLQCEKPKLKFFGGFIFSIINIFSPMF